MYNWSTDTRKLQKNPEKYTIWKLEQMVNFGLHGEKLDEAALRKYLPKMDIDQNRRKFLNLLLYGKKYSHYHSTKNP